MSNNNRTVYVGNLDRDTTEGMLSEVFSKCGTILKIRIIKNRFAFVEYDTEAQADRAIETLDNKKVNGSRVIVEECRSEKRPRYNDRQSKKDDK